MRSEPRHALVGKIAVNGDDAAAVVIDVFDLSNNGICTTVALLRYPLENELVVQTIDALFKDCSVFWDELAAEAFVAGHRPDISTGIQSRSTKGKQPAGTSAEVDKGLTILSENIQAARAATGLSAAELGKLIGVATKIVKRWEAGTETPSGDQLLMLAKATGIRVENLVPDTEPGRKRK